MPTPRINISDTVWRSARQRAIGEQKSVSQVVEDALSTYLTNRTMNTTHGSVTPNFTGAVSEGDLATASVEVPLHGIETRKDPIRGFRPVPKPKRR